MPKQQHIYIFRCPLFHLVEGQKCGKEHIDVYLVLHQTMSTPNRILQAQIQLPPMTNIKRLRASAPRAICLAIAIIWHIFWQNPSPLIAICWCQDMAILVPHLAPKTALSFLPLNASQLICTEFNLMILTWDCAETLPPFFYFLTL